MVQADVLDELPTPVHPIVRRVSSGSRRALDGLRPVGRADLVHGLDVDLPLRSRAPRVVTIHDLAVYDTPWAFSRYRVAGERLLTSRSVKVADEIISVSNFTAERVEHHFGRRSTVVPLAPPSCIPPAGPADIERVRRRHRLPERFVLQVSSIEPRKDTGLLARACARLAIPLVLAGGVSPRSWVPAGAQHLGYVDAAELPALLDAATVVAYLSRYEGFGLPPLEAMARRRPVIASDVGALRDVVGDGARLVPVGDEDRLVEVLRELWADVEARSDLAESGRRATVGLSWDTTAEATLGVYRNLGVRL